MEIFGELGKIILLVIIRGVFLARVRYDFLIYIYIYMLSRIINFNFILFDLLIYNKIN